MKTVGQKKDEQVTRGRGKWARPLKRRNKPIHHLHFTGEVVVETRTGSGTTVRTTDRIPTHSAGVIHQTVYTSPALMHAMDAFYAKIDADLAREEEQEYLRLCTHLDRCKGKKRAKRPHRGRTSRSGAGRR